MKISQSLLAHNQVLQRLEGLVSRQKLPNSLLFVGAESVGKYKTSLALSQYILCESQSACGHCPSCQRVHNEQHESLKIIKPEGGQIKVSQAREMVRFFSQKLGPKEYKVIIVDEAEKFNVQSSNALLKTLEEPPQNCFVILVTHSLYKLLVTIRSRCQIFRFGNLNKEQIKKIKPVEDWLVDFGDNNLNKIEQLTDSENQQVYMSLAESIASLTSGNYVNSLKKIEAYIKSKEQRFVLIQSLQHLVKNSIKRKLKLPTSSLSWQDEAVAKLESLEPVSYTHLTLPTILRV